MTDFGRDARDMPASDIGATSFNELAAGRHEGRREFLDWHYARSPFAMELARERLGLLGTAAPSDEREGDVPQYAFPLAQVRRWDADNDNARLWVVR